jgi:hypothetical protein
MSRRNAMVKSNHHHTFYAKKKSLISAVGPYKNVAFNLAEAQEL